MVYNEQFTTTTTVYYYYCKQLKEFICSLLKLVAVSVTSILICKLQKLFLVMLNFTSFHVLVFQHPKKIPQRIPFPFPTILTE